MSTLFIAILLVGVALLLLGIDLFLPTGGVLMFLAATSALTGMIFGFAHSAIAGGWLTLIVLLAIPGALFIFVKIYPSTAIGKKMIIDRPQAVPFEFSDSKQKQTLAKGAVGLAKTNLQPAGKIVIGNVEFEAVSETGIIVAGSAVIVTDIEMNVATVERYDVSMPVEVADGGANVPRHAQEKNAKETNLLDLPPEQFNLDDFGSTKGV